MQVLILIKHQYFNLFTESIHYVKKLLLSAEQTNLTSDEKQIEAAESRFKSGVIPKGDLLNTQSTAATDQQNVITQENALDLALLLASLYASLNCI